MVVDPRLHLTHRWVVNRRAGSQVEAALRKGGQKGRSHRVVEVGLLGVDEVGRVARGATTRKREHQQDRVLVVVRSHLVLHRPVSIDRSRPYVTKCLLRRAATSRTEHVVHVEDGLHHQGVVLAVAERVHHQRNRVSSGRVGESVVVTAWRGIEGKIERVLIGIVLPMRGRRRTHS